MAAEALIIFWYCIIIASILAYGMLDGFDLGVGALHLFAKKDEERRVFLNAIGPVWDGNEVWLVIVIGALFAGFPLAYATLFSAFYIPLTLLIFALIFRAVAIEFRSKSPLKRWRQTWDVLFFLGSVTIALIVGITIGNLIYGVPLDANHEYVGTMLSTFLRPYPLLVGVLTLSVFMMHGVIYLVMKTEGDLQERLKQWVQPVLIFFIITYVITTMVTLIYQDYMVELIRERPYLFVVVLANIFAIANIPREVNKKNYGWAFISSCANIGLLLALFAMGIFPYVIRSNLLPDINSIEIWHAASSAETLMVLFIIALIGLPLVFAYGFYVYHIFRGKVELDHMSY